MLYLMKNSLKDLINRTSEVEFSIQRKDLLYFTKRGAVTINMDVEGIKLIKAP